MDVLTMLAEARAAGLTVNAVGDRLVIRGPRRAEAFAHRLIEAKAAILAALAGDTAPPEVGYQAVPDLARVLPPLEWLTPKQRRLWRERSSYYERTHLMPQPAAEQEAMAELVMTGKLFDLGAVFRPDLIWLASSQKDGVEDDE